jgi:hypothetical protein
MPKVRALVPLQDEEGPIGIGEVFEANDEQAAALRAQGKVSLIADEEAAAKAAEHGVYDAVTGRDDVAGTPSGTPPGPQSDDEPPKKGKK